MKRKDRIFEELKNMSSAEAEAFRRKNGGGTALKGFTAIEIADASGYDRTNASKELNRMVKEGAVSKSTGRPVFFFITEILKELLGTGFCWDNEAGQWISKGGFLKGDLGKARTTETGVKPAETDMRPSEGSNGTGQGPEQQDAFCKMVGYDRSLEMVIKQAKAAILYPPRGLHCLLTGPTGVGKTAFAEVMFEYAQNSGIIGADRQLIAFNCAEYADNPGLLTSHLFGHAEGAFTGAHKDKKGLVELADGGILLLDEVHRLHPEGQEMLFLLMDKGIYKRLGETEQIRKANVLFICATTEDIDSSLLRTFTRRIPMILQLPALAKRSLTERLKLIETFFCDEYRNVNVPIHVHKTVLRSLLLYECTGNVGQLKGDIQILCARGFLDYKVQGHKELRIHNVPEHIHRGIFKYHDMREEIDRLLDFEKEYYVFDTQLTGQFFFKDTASPDYCMDIVKKYEHYLNLGLSEEEIDQIISRDLESYLGQLLLRCSADVKRANKEEIYKAVSKNVYDAVEIAFEVANKKLGKEFNIRVKIALALHISALIERIEKKGAVYKEEIHQIALTSPMEFQTAKLMRDILENELQVSIPKEEISFITMFLKLSDEYDLNPEDCINILVIAHGNYTASSIAGVVNTLLGTEDCNSIDMPLHVSVETTLEKTIEMVGSFESKKGTLLMVDMGSLTGFAEIIEERAGMPTRVVEMVSTPVVLEAVRKARFPDADLDELVEHVRDINPYLGRQVTMDLKQRLGMLPERRILTTCLTGEGTAVKIAGFLEQSIPGIKMQNIRITPINAGAFESYRYDVNQLIAVVGAVSLNIPGVPFIPLDEAIMGDGLKRLERLIDSTGYSHAPLGNQGKAAADDTIMLHMLSDNLVFLNPEKSYEAVKEAYGKLTGEGLLADSRKMKVQFILHNCCLIERVIQNQPLQYQNIDALLEQRRQAYDKVRKAFEPVEEIFGIEIPDTEIGYIVEMIDT